LEDAFTAAAAAAAATAQLLLLLSLLFSGKILLCVMKNDNTYI
jgi:hypothetical protein